MLRDQPRGEVAAVDDVRDLLGGEARVAARQRRAAEPDVGLHRAGPVDDRQAADADGRHLRDLGRHGAGPPAEGARGLVDRRVGIQVADQREHRARRADDPAVQGAQRGGLDGRHTARLGEFGAVGVAAVQTEQQRLAGEHGRLAAGDAELGDEPFTFADHLVIGVRGGPEHLGEQAQQPRELGSEPGSEDGKPVGVGVDRQAGAERLQVGGQLGAAALGGPGQDGLAQQGRLGQLDGERPVRLEAERDAQPQLDGRHGGPPHREDAQSRVERALGDRRQRYLPRGDDRGERPGRRPRRIGRRGHAASSAASPEPPSAPPAPASMTRIAFC